MSNEPDRDVTPAERVKDVPRMLAAIRQAVREALLRHKKLGHPVAVWRNERVEWVPPEEIPDYDETQDEASR